MNVDDIVIVAAKRTAIGGFLGAFSRIPAVDLGAMLIKGILDETGIAPAEIDQVIMGQVLIAGCGQNPARQTAIKAGLPNNVTGLTVNKVCGSGLVAVQLAAQAIRNGDADVVIAGGQENMSMAAYALPGGRQGVRLGHAQLVDTLVHDGLTDAFDHTHMGITAENVAEKYQVSRQDQDVFALMSQNKALAAIEAGRFESEILPLTIAQKRGDSVVSQDEGPRRTTYEQLAKLKPVFKKDGVVTAGNASTINDGAAAVVVCTRQKAQALGLTPLVSISAFANTGISPSLMGMGPVSAINACLMKAGRKVDDIDLFECNEAFAAQALAVKNELGLADEKVNINGGALALGHPIGASGCRILVSLIHQLHAKKLHAGIASLCVGGGEGVAMCVTRGESK